MDILLQLLGLAAVVVLAYLVFAMTVIRLVRRYWHFPVPPFVAVYLNSRLRKTMQPPRQVVDWMELQPGMQALEIGPGPGTFTFETASRVGPAGRVYGADIQPAMVRALKREIDKAGVSNVHPLVASAYALPVPARSLDRVCMITVLAEIPDRGRALRAAAAALKPGGRVCIGEFLPDPDYPRRRTVIGWCEAAGLRLAASHGTMLHYVLSFEAA